MKSVCPASSTGMNRLGRGARSYNVRPCEYGMTESAVPWSIAIGHFTFWILSQFGNGSTSNSRIRVTTRGAER